MKDNHEIEYYESAGAGEKQASSFAELIELGDCYLSVGDYTQAQCCYDRAADIDADRAEPYVGIGAVAFEKGRNDEAANAFRVALRLDPASSRAHCGLAMVYQAVGSYSEAFDAYLKCLEHDTDNLSALLGLFQASCQMGSFGKVIHYLEVYLGMHPDDHSVMFCLATLYLREAKLVKAHQMLTAVLEGDPENSDAANLLEEVEHKLAQLKADVA